MGIIANWDMWSGMVAVNLLDIMSGWIHLKMCYLRILDWLVILAGCNIKGINELGARESQNSLVTLILQSKRPETKRFTTLTVQKL